MHRNESENYKKSPSIFKKSHFSYIHEIYFISDSYIN